MIRCYALGMFMKKITSRSKSHPAILGGILPHLKGLNNMLPVLLRDKFVIVGNENQRLTRQAGNIVLEYQECAKKCVL